MAASTTSHGWCVERKSAAEAMMSADWAIKATRGLQALRRPADGEGHGGAGEQGQGDGHAELGRVQPQLGQV